MISKYFPDVPATWKDITIWHLLTHTSGLGDYPPEIDLKRDYTEDEFFACIQKSTTGFRARLELELQQCWLCDVGDSDQKDHRQVLWRLHEGANFPTAAT